MPAEANPALEALKKKFAASMPDRLGKIEAACDALPSGSYEEELYQTAYRLAHNLKGASGTYGFPDVSQQAGELEGLCRNCNEGKSPMDDSVREQAKRLIAQLRTTIDDAVKKATA